VTAVETLPAPEDVRRTFEQMKTAVMAAYAERTRDIEDARGIIATAEAEQAAIRERYPMFFPEEAQAAAAARRNRGTPSVEQMNKALRVIADHPDQTIKQLARRLNYSDSWVSLTIQTLNRQRSLVSRERHGRSRIYRLTADGQQVLNRGGIRP
jgi:predicted transcriptional regulator